MIWKIGWDQFTEYDEPIPCNDSCFGLLYDMKMIFDRTSADTNCDFWGLSEAFSKNIYLVSYFLVLKNNVFQ